MDPLTGAAIAVGSIIATKALEKTGEKVAEEPRFGNKQENFLLPWNKFLQILSPQLKKHRNNL